MQGGGEKIQYLRSFSRRHRSRNTPVSISLKKYKMFARWCFEIFKKSCSYFICIKILSHWNLLFENSKNILHFQIFKMSLWAWSRKFLTGNSKMHRKILHGCWRRNVLVTTLQYWRRFWPFFFHQNPLSFYIIVGAQYSKNVAKIKNLSLTSENCPQLWITNITFTWKSVAMSFFQ